MNYITRRPDFYIAIKRPNYSSAIYTPGSARTVGVWTSDIGNNTLVGYAFRESLAVTDSNFSLTFTPEADSNGLTWFDKIKVTDLVFIEELGKDKFIGIVSSRKYSSRVVDEGVQRTITISGRGLTSLLSTYNLILDTFLYDSDVFAEAENQKLKAALTEKMDKGQQVISILKTIYDAFFSLMFKMGRTNRTGIGIKAILDYFIDFETDLLSDVVLLYPISLSIYRPGNNNIWGVLVSLINPPVNELFTRFNFERNKFHVVYRQAPFDAKDWSKLKSNKIPSILITSCDFGSSDEEVYTYYLATVAGSGINDRKAILLDAEGYKKLAERDEDKWIKYGYKPMLVEFKFFNKDVVESYTETASTMHYLAMKLRTWFEHNDEFLNGTIEFMTSD